MERGLSFSGSTIRRFDGSTSTFGPSKASGMDKADARHMIRSGPGTSESNFLEKMEQDTRHDRAVRQVDLDADMEKQESQEELDSISHEESDREEESVGDGSRESNPTSQEEPEWRGLAATLDRVLSRASTKSVNPGPPPDGGVQAWMIGTGPPF